jgi:hypothetical protein
MIVRALEEHLTLLQIGIQTLMSELNGAESRAAQFAMQSLNSAMIF